MPKRVRLLTFQALPHRAFLKQDSAVATAIDQLTAESVFFENHHLQSPAWSSICGDPMLDDAQQGVSLPDASVAPVVLKCGAVDTDDVNDLPAFFDNHLAVNIDEASAEIPDSERKRLQNSSFLWLHCILPSMENDVATTFRNAVGFSRSLCDSESESVVFISTLTGHPSGPKRPFESMLFGGFIHVPLWMLSPDQQCCRIQSITGSYDLKHTICEILGGTNVSDPPELPELKAPLNLLDSSRNPGRRIERQLAIQWHAVDAIRTANFLFVQRRSTGPGDTLDAVSDRALFAKPDDVWNLHDVSAEYHEIVRTLATGC